MPSFGFPKIFVTESICKGSTVTEVYITVLFTGSIAFKITADGGDNWEDVTLVTGVRKLHTFSTSGTDVQFMAIGNSGAIIASTRDTFDNFVLPGIKIEITGLS